MMCYVMEKEKYIYKKNFYENEMKLMKRKNALDH